MRIGYFINQYPAVPHTFIRREIQALETIGVKVVRYALKSLTADLSDKDDLAETQLTYLILKPTLSDLSGCLFMLLRRPQAAFAVLRLAIKMGWRSDRGIPRHFAYAAEAAMLAYRCRLDGVMHLHAHFGTNSTAIALMAREFYKLPYSFTAHGSEEFEKAPLLSLDTKLRHAAFAVCVSSFGRSQLMRWSEPDQWSKIAVVHCGVDKTFLQMLLTPPPAAPRLVCVGRLGEHKAQLILIAAAQRLRDCGIHCEIVLVGDGPMRANVERAIRDCKLEGQVEITGWVSGDRVRREMIAARALVLPSFSENMPVVIMEAMALGRPVISTYIAGIPELVQPGKTGWLVPASDELALAAAMKEVLSASVERLERMGIAGRDHIAQQHDAVKEAVKLKRLFEQCATLTW
jgi:glycosyltransferase involved in cell wall biosynthesis